MPIPNMNQVYQSIGNEADAVRNNSIKPAGKILFHATFSVLGMLWIAISQSAALQVGANMPSDNIQNDWRGIVERYEREAHTFASISVLGVRSPVGRWSLLRKGKDLCAVRFTSFHRAHPKDKSIRENEESFFANYDWIYQGDGSNKFSKPNIKYGHSQASIKPNIWRFLRGTNYIECGPLEATWNYPNGIALIASDFHPEKANRSNDIEIALTGWTEITQINSQDPRLTWHQYYPVRDFEHTLNKFIMIPIEQLPR